MLLYGLFPYPGRMKAALAPARWLQRTKLDRFIDRSGLPRLLPGFVRRMYDQLPRLQPSAPAMPELLPAIGPRRARVGLFAGCVAQAMFPQTNWATARVLQANGCDVVVPKSQVCCGAIHYHSGAEGPALEFAARNAAAFDVASLDAVIVNVAGCGSMLKDYGHIAEEASHRSQEIPLADKPPVPPGARQENSTGGNSGYPDGLRTVRTPLLVSRPRSATSPSFWQSLARFRPPENSASRCLPRRLPPGPCPAGAASSRESFGPGPRPGAGAAGRVGSLLRGRRQLQPDGTRNVRAAFATKAAEHSGLRPSGGHHRQRRLLAADSGGPSPGRVADLGRSSDGRARPELPRGPATRKLRGSDRRWGRSKPSSSTSTA